MSTRLFAALCLSAVCGVTNADVGRVTYTGQECKNGVCRQVQSIGTCFSVGTSNGRTIWLGPGHGAFRKGSTVRIANFDRRTTVTGTVLYKEVTGEADVAIISSAAPAKWHYKFHTPAAGDRVRVFGYPNGSQRRHSFVSTIIRSGYRGYPYRVQVPDELASGYSGGPLSADDRQGRRFALGSIWGGDGTFTPADRLQSRVRQVTMRKLEFTGTPSPEYDDFAQVDGEEPAPPALPDTPQQPMPPVQQPPTRPGSQCSFPPFPVPGDIDGDGDVDCVPVTPGYVFQSQPVYVPFPLMVPLVQRTRYYPQVRYVPRVEYDPQVSWHPVTSWEFP